MTRSRPPVRAALSAIRDTIRTQLWPLPTAGVVVALVLGVVLPRVDRHIDDAVPRWLSDLFFTGSPSAARSVLEAIAGSLITVTSLTFSLTVVTLQLASSQFSPRLLRTFTRDLFVQGTLALFLATFTFALTALRSVRDADGGADAFVPRISVSVAFLLSVASVLGLVLFLAHLAQQIRVETMLRNVHTDASESVTRVLGDGAAEDESFRPPMVPRAPSLLTVDESGFLLRVDEARLLEVAVDLDVLIAVDLRPGDSTIAGTPFAAAWARDVRILDESVHAEIVRRARQAVHLGFERNAVQDVAFGLRQLTDVATKALSPGINDPTTAIHALGHASALLCELAGHRLGPRVLRDGDERVCVVLARPGLAELTELAIGQPRRYGAGDPFVLARILDLLRELAWTAGRVANAIVTDQLRRVRASIAAADFDDAELARLAARGDRVEKALAGVWSPPRDDVTPSVR